MEQEAQEQAERIEKLERELGYLPKSEHPMDIARWKKENAY